MSAAPDEINGILHAAERGDAGALDRLLPLVYDELRVMAQGFLGHERPDHTLQPTALVHEAYLKLIDQRSAWADRRHFFAVAALAMRRILVNHARARGRLKRGGAGRRVALSDADVAVSDRSIDLVALDEALVRLAEIDADQVKLVELRFFAGLTNAEAARVLDVSPRTAHADWALARAWLRGELEDTDGDDA